MKPRKLTKKEELAIRALREIEKIWPDTLMLFSFSGSLVACDTETGQIFDDIDIPNEGGDPGVDMIDGVEFVCRIR